MKWSIRNGGESTESTQKCTWRTRGECWGRYLKKNGDFLSWPNGSNIIFSINHCNSKTPICDCSYFCRIFRVVANCEWRIRSFTTTLAQHQQSTRQQHDATNGVYATVRTKDMSQRGLWRLRKYPAHCRANCFLEGNFCNEAEVFQTCIARDMNWWAILRVAVSLLYRTTPPPAESILSLRIEFWEIWRCSWIEDTFAEAVLVEDCVEICVDDTVEDCVVEDWVVENTTIRDVIERGTWLGDLCLRRLLRGFLFACLCFRFLFTSYYPFSCICFLGDCCIVFCTDSCFSRIHLTNFLTELRPPWFHFEMQRREGSEDFSLCA